MFYSSNDEADDISSSEYSSGESIEASGSDISLEEASIGSLKSFIVQDNERGLGKRVQLSTMKPISLAKRRLIIHTSDEEGMTYIIHIFSFT